MPKGPQGQKRPADVIGNAVHVMRIATGQIEESLPKTRRAEGGKKGGPARSKKLTPARRKEIAEKAAKARWQRPKA
jgi:NADP-dependent 3-hydroxy acid dehydrogenase YdfG